MKLIPQSLLKGIYVPHSLCRIQNGFVFRVRSPELGVVVNKVGDPLIDGLPWTVDGVSFIIGPKTKKAGGIRPRSPWKVPADTEIIVQIQGKVLGNERHDVKLPVDLKGAGRVEISLSDEIRGGSQQETW